MATAPRPSPPPKPKPSPRSSVVTPREIREAAAGRGASRAVRRSCTWSSSAPPEARERAAIGAFKIRGAYNAYDVCRPTYDSRVSSPTPRGITPGRRVRGAKVRRARGLVMPETAPAVKVEGVTRWGGEVVRRPHLRRSAHQAEAIAAQDQLAVVPPFDHADIVGARRRWRSRSSSSCRPWTPSSSRSRRRADFRSRRRLAAAGATPPAVWGVEPAGAPKLQRSLAACARPARAHGEHRRGLITLSVGESPSPS